MRTTIPRGGPTNGKADPHGFLARLTALGYEPGKGAYSALSRESGVPHQRVEALMDLTPTGRTPHSRKYIEAVSAALDRMEAARTTTAADRPAKIPARAPMRLHAAGPGFTVVVDTEMTPEGPLLTQQAHSNVRIPEALDGIEGVFGIAIRDGSMAPVVRRGDRVVVNPLGIPTPGSRVVLIGDEGLYVLREYIDEDQLAWVVRRYGKDPGDERVSKAKFRRALTVAVIIQRG